MLDRLDMSSILNINVMHCYGLTTHRMLRSYNERDSPNRLENLEFKAYELMRQRTSTPIQHTDYYDETRSKTITKKYVFRPEVK